MKLDQDLLKELPSIHWLERCGSEPPNFPFPTRQLRGWDEVMNSFKSGWLEKTENAHGELTDYLSTHHPAAYQGVWNRLVKEGRQKVEETAGRAAQALAVAHGFDLVSIVNWDVLGAVMETSYRSSIPPSFFVNLLDVYRSGHLPCGQDQDGTILIY